MGFSIFTLLIFRVCDSVTATFGSFLREPAVPALCRRAAPASLAIFRARTPPGFQLRISSACWQAVARTKQLWAEGVRLRTERPCRFQPGVTVRNHFFSGDNQFFLKCNPPKLLVFFLNSGNNSNPAISPNLAGLQRV